MTKILRFILLCSVTTAAATAAQPDAKGLYLGKCASCHGKQGERKALNTSRPIASLTQAQVENALNGYKDGDYGGKLKKVKQGIARTLNAEEIAGLARYVTTLQAGE